MPEIYLQNFSVNAGQNFTIAGHIQSDKIP